MRLRKILTIQALVCLSSLTMSGESLESEGGVPLPGASDVVRDAMANEKNIPKGTVTLHVTPGEHYEPRGDKMREELGEGIWVDFTRHDPSIFRITLYREDAVVRTIISDGACIDAGDGTLWEGRFDFKGRAEGTDEGLEDEFEEL